MKARNNKDCNNEDYLSNLPNDVLLNEIVPYLTAGSNINLYFFNTNLYFLSNRFHELLSGKDQASRLDSLRQLLNYGALGELGAARKIWRKEPSLLSCYGTVYHPNRSYKSEYIYHDIPQEKNPGRYKFVNHTFWQILLMNEEFEEAEVAGKLMTKAERRKQFIEIFPEGGVKCSNWDYNRAVYLLEDLLKKIKNDKTLNSFNCPYVNVNNRGYYELRTNNQTKSALDKLYNYLKPKPEHKIGLVFDSFIYVKAMAYYDASYAKLNQYQRIFWCIRVEEWLASCMGTRHLRTHSQGIFNQKSRTSCSLSSGSSYFAFRRSAQSIPGFHFFYSSNGVKCSGYREPHFELRTKIYLNYRVCFFQKFAETVMKKGEELQSNVVYGSL